MSEDIEAARAEAIHALGVATTYQEGLTARSVGVALMGLGFAFAGIFLSYAVAEHELAAAPDLFFHVLWVPWIAGALILAGAHMRAAGVVITWRDRAMSGTLVVLALTASYFVLGASYLALFVGALDFAGNTNPTLLIVTGAFTMALAAGARLGTALKASRLFGPLAAAGVVMIVCGAIVLADLGRADNALLAAAAAGIPLFASGVYFHLRG